MKNFKFAFLFFALFSIVACSSDDSSDTDQTADLLGTWERIDSTSLNNHSFTFNEDGSGWKIVGESNEEGTGISSLIMFDWVINNDILNMEYDATGDLLETSFSINNEQLLLSDISDLLFNKL